VALLAAGSIVTAVDTNNMALRVGMIVIGVLILIGALVFSSKQEEADFGGGPETEPAERIEERV
jgi:hypothetical protein